MPPKKVTNDETAATNGSSIKPEEAEFFLQCLRSLDENGVMDYSVLSLAVGHTNIGSTRNTFNRLKKKWGLGNVQTKNGGMPSAQTSDKAKKASAPLDQADVLNPNPSLTSKVEKKRGRPPSAKMTKSQAAVAKIMKIKNEDEATEENAKSEEGEDA